MTSADHPSTDRTAQPRRPATALAAAHPAVVRIGRAPGRGCGIVVAAGRVLTNAHNLRDRTTEVAFADGRTEQGRIAGVDPDGDLVVLEVDTGDTPAAGVGRRGGRARRGRVRGGPRRRRRRAHHLRHGERRRAQLPRSAGPPHHRQPGAHRAPGPRLLGQPVGRRERPAAGDQHRPPGRRLLPGHPRRRRSCARESTRWCAASRCIVSCWASAWPRPTWRASCARRSGSPTARGCWCARSRPTAPPSAAGVKTGDLITQADGDDVATVDALHRALDAARGGRHLTLHVVRGADELDLTVDFNEPDRVDGAFDDAASAEGRARAVADGSRRGEELRRRRAQLRSRCSSRRAAKRRPALPIRSMRRTSDGPRRSASASSPSSASMPQWRRTTGTRI